MVYLYQQVKSESIKPTASNYDNLNIYWDLLHYKSETNVEAAYPSKIHEDRNWIAKCVVRVNFFSSSGNKFEEACIDSRAQMTLIEMKQARLYRQMMNETTHLTPSNKSFCYS